MLSIITPVYNGGKFIKKNIEAIQKLSIPFEHIIVDGGSTDDTLDILEDYPHLKVYQQDGKEGMYQAIHQGFKVAKGPYICWVNCDDRVVPEGFEKMYKIISKNKANLVYGDSVMHWTQKNEKELKRGIHFGKFLLNSGRLPFIQPSSIYTKQLYLDAGELRYKKFRIIGDKDLFVRMSKVDNFQAIYVPIVSSIFLKHGNSLGDNNHDLYLQELEHCPSKKNIIYPMIYHGSLIFQRIFSKKQVL